MKLKIGYVDENPREVARYERKLRDWFDVIGYDIEKGLTLTELLDRVYESDIDLLMVDFLMKEKGILSYNGDEVVRAFEEIRPRFPMIIFTSYNNQAFPEVDNPNIIYDKSILKDDRGYFVTVLQKNIKVYKDFIQKRKDVINTLLEKGEREVLSELEKNELLQSQMELKNLDKRLNEVPYQLLNAKTSEDLSELRREAEEFLEALIKNRK